MTILKSISVSLVLVGFAVPPAVAQSVSSATPILNDLSASSETKLSVERIEQCLLAAKVIEHASTIDMIDESHAKTVRAKMASPKLEAMLRDRSQTQAIFDQKVMALKSEYNHFKVSDKSEKKRLYKISKNANKSCGRAVERLRPGSIGRTQAIADLIPSTSSDTAKICYSISATNMGDNIASLLSGLGQTMAWERVYRTAKRREGHPASELVAPLSLKDESAELKTVEKSRAMRLFKDCKSKYEEASFEYKLTKPDAGTEFVSIVDWD